jgi:hypothetical protein
MWSETAVRLRDRDSAKTLHALCTPLDGTTWGSAGIWCGPVARILARFEDLLDRPDVANEHFADAITQSKNVMSPVWVARCQLDWAECLIARGDTSRAVELANATDETIGHLMLPALKQQSADLRGTLLTQRS